MSLLAPPKRLILLDGMALIYRAHFALIRSPRFTTSGTCTSAVFGIANTLLDLAANQTPTHWAAAFDTAEPTHRHEEFPAYKAQRDALPEDIAEQFPLVDRLLDAFQIPILRAPGYEADDIIGTLAQQAEEAGLETWMVTPDKDFAQLVTANTLVFKPGRKGSEYELLGVSEILDKWNIARVEQVIDILGLMGDSSDNIPGVPGVGEKTAQKLIAQYDSVENLLQHVHELKGKQKERLEEHAELALLSKRLVTIQRDVPLDVDLEALAWSQYDEDALRQVFGELEFETLGKRVFGKSFTAAPARVAAIREKRAVEIQARLFDEPVDDVLTLKDVPHTYHTVDTEEGREALRGQLLKQAQVCFDTETTGLDPREAAPLGIAFCWEPHVAHYVVIPEDRPRAQSILEFFQPFWQHDRIEKIGHNLKYDLSLLRWHGIRVEGPFFDTMLGHSMKEPEMRHGLDDLAKLYLNYQPIATEELLGTASAEASKNMRDVPLARLAEYACEDADVTFRVAQVLRPEIEADGVAQVCYDVECPLTPVLVDMEFEGIRLDVDALTDCAQRLTEEIEQLRQGIFESAGHEFNLDSPKQLGVVLFDELQLEANPKKTATGQYSTREAELVRLSGQHAIVRDILDYRHAAKLKSVYVDQLPAAVHPRTGHVHTHYSQTWTSTGRMQSNDPNLQTIPVRKERGREIRAAFVPRNDEFRILAADYSQIELRIMAALSEDPEMLEAFRNGTDIHRSTAAKVYKVGLDEVSREMRDKAKMVNFGILYGISAFGLQQRLGIPRAEANSLIKNYFER